MTNWCIEHGVKVERKFCLRCWEAEVAALRATCERAVTIADECLGPFPVQTPEEALSCIEQGFYDWRLELNRARADVSRLQAMVYDRDDRLAVATADVARLQGELAEARAALERTGEDLDHAVKVGDEAAVRLQQAEGLLRVARKALEEIEDTDTDWTVGPDANMGTLRTIAFRALSALGEGGAAAVEGKVPASSHASPPATPAAQ